MSGFHVARSNIASLITWAQAGVGALVRNVQDRFRETVSAGDYATLQEALDTGKVVRLVEGVQYPVTDQITVPSGGGIIGRGILTISSADFTGTTQAVSTETVPILCESVEDITLHGFVIEVTAGQNSNLYLIALRDVDRADVFGVRVTGLNGGAAVKVDSSRDIAITRLQVHDCELDRSADSGQLTGVEVDNHRIASVGSERVAVRHSIFRDLTVTALFLAAYGWQTDGVNIQVGASACDVSYNVMDNVGEGVDYFCDDSSIIGNIIRNAYGVGVKLVHGASRNLVAKNRIIKPGLGGLMIAGSSTAAKDTDSNYIIGNLISGVNDSGAWNAETTYAIGCNNDGTYKATNTVLRGNHTVDSPGADCNILFGGSGAGNIAYENTSDGSPVTETTGGGGTVYIPGYLGDSTGLCRIHGSDPRFIFHDNDASATEKVWDQAISGPSLYRRTLTDLEASGETFEQVTRSGTSVTELWWNAVAMKFGGRSSVNRHSTFDNLGTLTQRYDDNGQAPANIARNYGIAAANQGTAWTAVFGTGGASGGTAYRARVLSTDTWAAGAQRSAKYVIELMLADNLKEVVEFDPAKGVVVLTAGMGLQVKEGSNAKQGTATLVAGTVTVNNTSVTANSRIFLTSQADGGTPGFLRVSARVAATSFTITSSDGADTSTVAYEIFEPA